MNDVLVRYAKLTAWDEKGNSVLETVEDQRVQFEMKKDVKSYCNMLSVRVYGLERSDAEPALTLGNEIQLEAGTKAFHGVIFRGNLIDGFFANGDTPYLQLECLDGDSFYNGYISMAVGAGESLANIAVLCAQRSSSPLTVGRISKYATQIRLPRGCVLFGQTADIMDSLAKQINGVWYVNDERLYLLTEDEMQVGSVIDIDADDDLVGVPVVDAWSVSFGHHIDSRIALGSTVRFDRKDVAFGQFRVVSLSAVGDTYDGGWKMTVYALRQDGNSPSMSAATHNIWR